MCVRVFVCVCVFGVLLNACNIIHINSAAIYVIDYDVCCCRYNVGLATTM